MKYLDKNQNPFFIDGKSKAFIWDDTRAFLAVARLGTLTAAAELLQVGIATLSRRVERLENALGAPLFIRLQSGYQLTEEGRGLVEKAETIEQAVFSLLSSGFNKSTEISGKVRLATTENLANEIILPALPEFQSKFPELAIELVTDTQLANLHRHDADLAIRMVRPTQGHVTFRQIGRLEFGLYDGKNKTNAEINLETKFVMWDEQYRHLPGGEWVEKQLRGRLPSLTVTSLASMIAATQAGLGLAVLPHFIAQKAGLSCIRSDMGIEQPIYLVIQADLAHSRRVRTVADFLVDVINKNQSIFERGE
ncbi:LysR family transcriptional regulator [Photobacterium sp. GJ3]|uniref:LysR family transcriptional regulator n=1 Tax=Photobacterium sp. GJ3 TaxID=2829502 RepID=UPI001B8B726E|nr:LysR family transcriptional regulator [Photobacterium sp. GJ3]QUJ66795.1 LysR family transcriptional regulator [Photobacterium sp. GJ3]